ncbi:hypothetical protein NliqN6_4431 [Naganishia liquefaciens]|uniref:MFS transporter n=1 Tax=Naganishia liquefaciens TaxID=104408 RepID=A0A8H3YFV2_9TREE|nr:hypothetical protein NliqN6_4431 [Naganishia liquefaciens]
MSRPNMAHKPSSTRAASPNRILPYTLLITIGPSVTAATSLFVIRYLMCHAYYAHHPSKHGIPAPGDERCNVSDIEGLTSSVMAGLTTMDGLLSFLMTSFVQRLADKLGRRPLLVTLPLLAMVSTAALLIGYLVRKEAITYLCLIIAGTFVSASTKAAFTPTLCISDLTTEHNRSKYYSRLESMALFGPCLAFVISALANRYTPYVTLPYYIALASQLLASLYAFSAIRETLCAEKDTSSDEENDASTSEGLVERAVDRVAVPVKPLRVLIPWRDERGVLRWELAALAISLFATTCGTIFIPTAVLFFLSDKFNFNTEKNAWVLAYLAATRAFYLFCIFPFILRYGRAVFHWLKERKRAARDGEARPLLASRPSIASSLMRKNTADEANHFDVILAFGSVVLDGLSFAFVFMAPSYQYVLASFILVALGAGDVPSYRSAFIAASPEDRTTEALAALDMVLNIAKLASPPLLGALYTVFVRRGKPEVVFLAASGCCALGAIALFPLLFRKLSRE